MKNYLFCALLILVMVGCGNSTKYTISSSAEQLAGMEMAYLGIEEGRELKIMNPDGKVLYKKQIEDMEF